MIHWGRGHLGAIAINFLLILSGYFCIKTFLMVENVSIGVRPFRKILIREVARIRSILIIVDRQWFIDRVRALLPED
ncbi:MAG: hypothetical protein EBE86_030025 [Hormoscilla sp. GUM202]|nr:hypothetical protein [Hormoscilla sp. GUM202]